MFNAMKDGIKEETIRQLFILRKQVLPKIEEEGSTDLNHDGKLDSRDFRDDESGRPAPDSLRTSGPQEP